MGNSCVGTRMLGVIVGGGVGVGVPSGAV